MSLTYSVKLHLLSKQASALHQLSFFSNLASFERHRGSKYMTCSYISDVCFGNIKRVSAKDIHTREKCPQYKNAKYTIKRLF